MIDRSRLIETILSPKPSKVIVSLPDFYLDHIASYPYEVERFIEEVRRIAQQGGGNIIDIPQHYTLGGNAANFADTLARLGLKVSLIARTSEFGHLCLQYLLKGLNVDILHVKSDSKLSTSSIIETQIDGRAVNIMIGEAGGLKDFSPQKLAEEDLELLKNADYICLFNWCQNKFGTELFLYIAEHVGEDAFLFFDIGDPSSRVDELKTLCEKMCKVGVGALSLNENEAYWVGKVLGCTSDDRAELARYISERLEGEVLLHTPNFSTHNIKGEVTKVPTFDVKPQKSTGAGDCWNAGYILGSILNLSYEERLFLANAVAAAHITKPAFERLTLDDVVRVLSTAKLRC
jgi:sugar/nucleoside kinase (ribokinase family)